MMRGARQRTGPSHALPRRLAGHRGSLSRRTASVPHAHPGRPGDGVLHRAFIDRSLLQPASPDLFRDAHEHLHHDIGMMPHVGRRSPTWEFGVKKRA